MEDAVITPEDEEVEDAEFTEGEATPKVSKKKVIKVEENRSKREHVNVVFIGHVGKLPAIIDYIVHILILLSLSSYRCW